MHPSAARLATLLLLLAAPWGAARGQAYEGARREQADAGVHQPVMTKPPQLLEEAQAEYPPQAQAEGLSGAVKMLLTIEADGSVGDVEVVEPLGHGFDEAAVAAVKRFRFSPAEVDGVPAPIRVEYVYNFVLREAPPPAQPATPAPGTLTGRLLERGSRSWVVGGTVRCGDAADAPEALSDAEGRFTLSVPGGTACEVRAVAQGYKLFRTSETLEPGEVREVVFHLLPEAVGFETVVRANRDKKEVVRRTLQRQELQRIPGTFGDPIRVLQNLPGVARVPFAGGQLIVRGAAPSQTLTFLDGVEVPLIFHLGGGPSVINAEFLDRIDFFPGGFGSQYGRAIGGVVDVATRKGASDTLHGSVKIDLLDSGFFLESPLTEGISVAAAARRSYVDVLLPLVLPRQEGGGTLSVLPVYWDYQARADFGARRGEKAGSTGYVMAFGSEDILKVVATGSGLDRDVTVDTRTLFHRVKGDWTLRGGNATSVFTPFLGYDRASFGFGEAALQADVYNAGGRELVTLELSEALTARTGFDVLFQHIRGRASLPTLNIEYVPFPGDEPRREVREIVQIVNGFDGALFGEVDVKVGPVTVTPSLRGTYARKAGQQQTTADPRLFARVQAHERFAVKGSAGLYSQAPDPTQVVAPPYGLPTIGFQRAFQTSLGVEQRFTDAISLDLTGYYNRRYDLIVRPGLTTETGTGTVTRDPLGNLGLGRAYGLEVMLKHDVTSRFFGWLAYTLNRSETRRSGGGDYTLTDFDQTHILAAVASYRLPFWDLELGGRFRYVTGRPSTPELACADLWQADSNSYAGCFGDVRSARLPAFQQLDVRLDKNFVFESWTLNAYLDVQNVYNAQNVETQLYDYRFRQVFNVPGIPFLPVIGVKGSF
jgi:TonB family protein